MQSPLQWQFEIFDKISAPSKAMEKAQAGVTKSVEGATKAVEKVDRANATVEKSIRRVTEETQKQEKATSNGGRSWLDLAAKLSVFSQIAGMARGVIGGVVGGAMDLLGILGDVESSRMSFGLLLGAKGGNELIDYLNRVQKHTQMTRAQLRDLVAPLVAQGFGTKEISRLLPAGLDVGAMFGGGQRGAAAAARALDIFAKIKSTGRMEGEAFNALGLSEKDVLGRVAKAMGIVGPKAIELVKQKIAAGKVSSGDLLESIFGAITAKTNGKLGTGAIQAAGTVEALLNRIKGAPAALLESLEQSPAFGSIRRLLQNFADTLDPQSKTGKEITERLAKAFEVVGAALDKISIEDVVAGFRMVIGAFDVVVSIGRGVYAVFGAIADAVAFAASTMFHFGIAFWKGVWAFGDALGDLVGRVAVWFADLGYTIVEGIKAVGKFFGGERLRDILVAVGGFAWSLIEGLVNGISDGIGRAVEAVGELGGAIVGKLKSVLGIASPSKVFADIGRFSALGFVEGIEGSASLVEGAYATAFAPDVPSASGSATAGVGGGPLVDASGWQFNIGAPPAGTSPHDFAEMVGDIVEERLEQYALALGVRA